MDFSSPNINSYNNSAEVETLVLDEDISFDEDWHSRRQEQINEEAKIRKEQEEKRAKEIEEAKNAEIEKNLTEENYKRPWTFKDILATAIDVSAHFIQGGLSVAEEVVDGTVVITGAVAVYGSKISNALFDTNIDVENIENSVSYLTEDSWSEAAANLVTESDFVKNNSRASDDVLYYAGVAGKITGNVFLNSVTGGGGVALSAVQGAGRGYVRARQNNASFDQAMANAAFQGVVSGTTKYALKNVGSEATSQGLKDGMQGIDKAKSLLYYSAQGAKISGTGAIVSSFGEYETYGKNNEEDILKYYVSSGGLENTLVQATAGAVSTGIKYNNSYNDSYNTVNVDKNNRIVLKERHKEIVKGSSKEVTKSGYHYMENGPDANHNNKENYKDIANAINKSFAKSSTYGIESGMKNNK